MFNLIDKWLKKNPATENETLIDAPRAGLSRRGFITGLVGGFVGISTGIIQPSKKIVVAAIGMPNQYLLAINTPLDRAYLRPLQMPLYNTEMTDWENMPASLVTYFQRPIQKTPQISFDEMFAQLASRKREHA